VKPTASKRKSSNQAAGNVITFGGTYSDSYSDPYTDTKNRPDHIAIAAYFKAESRCFEPGRELDDWLAAEAEFDRQLGQGQ
jgi:hypothetical protein